MCFSENPDMIHTETETHMHCPSTAFVFVRMQNCNYINSGDGRATAEYRLKTMKTMMWLMISSADFSIASVQQCSTVIFY